MFFRISKKFISLTTLFFLVVLSAFAAEKEGARKLITFSQAKEIFHRANTDIKVAEIDKKIALRSASAAPSWIPSLAVSSSIKSGAMSLTPSKTDWTWSEKSSIAASANLSVGASNFTSIFSSIIQSNLAEYTYDTTISNLDMALYVSYASLASAIEALSSARKSLEIAKQAEENTQKKFDSGLASSLELMNAKLSCAKAESNFVSLQNTRNKAYYNLKNMLKVDYDFDISDINDIAFVNLPDASQLYKKYLSSNSTIRPLSIAYKANELGYKATALAYRLPTFTAALNYQYGPRNALGFDDSMSFALNASMSLDGFIPGTSAWNSINKAKDEFKASGLKLEDGFYSYREKLSENIDNINLLETKYTSSLRQLELASESYRLTKDAYDKGSVSMTQFDQAMENLLGAEVALIGANLDYKTAVYKFAVYLGEDFDKFVETYRK